MLICEYFKYLIFERLFHGFKDFITVEQLVKDTSQIYFSEINWLVVVLKKIHSENGDNFIFLKNSLHVIRQIVMHSKATGEAQIVLFELLPFLSGR